MLLICPYLGGIFTPSWLRIGGNLVLTGELSAFVPSLKSFQGGWWIAYTSGMDLKSQWGTCFHGWKWPAGPAPFQPQGILGRRYPTLKCPVLHSSQEFALTNLLGGCLVGRQWRMSWYSFLPWRWSCPGGKQRRWLAKKGERQRTILERQV